MTQLAEYVTLVDDKGFDGLPTAIKQRAVNAARRRLIKDRRWMFLDSTSAALSTTALSSQVSLAALTTLAHVDAVRVTVSGVEREMSFMPRQELRHEQAARSSNGAPRFWTRRNGVLLLYPTPDAVYTLTVEYVANLADLSGVTEDSIPEDYQDLVAWAAIPDLAFRQRDAIAGQFSENQYQMLLRQAAAQENIQQRQGSRQVKTGYWGARSR